MSNEIPEQAEPDSYSEKVFWVSSNPNVAAFAYERLGVHRAAADKQMERIWDANTRSKSSPAPPGRDASPQEIKAYVGAKRESMIPVLYETHFYFVAWTDCRNMLKILVDLPEFLDAKKVFDSYRELFDHYADARHSFEHFHNRLTGQGDRLPVQEVRENPKAGTRQILFGFEGGNYKHSDQLWDITPASLELLHRVIDDVLVVLHRTINVIIQSKDGFPDSI